MNTRAVALPKSLPDPAQWSQLIARYKEFRLLSLQLSPESFGSSYAREVAFSEEIWASRLNNPVALNTIIVSEPDAEAETTDDISLILNSPWLAALTLVGPLEAKTAAKSYEDKMHLQPDTVSFGPPAPGVDSTYVLNAMYVLPTERRKGHSYKIIEFAKQVALRENNGAKVTLALILDNDNMPAMKSYEKSGFKVVHRYWFDDTRGGEVKKKTRAAVMRVDIGVDDSV
ncbi:Hypothetical protein NCS54_00208100 [Fusarium falciforme]|uniref:Hypothetical protein n=1 Tax=Fusarium falciforme TaxID=195108 RepID=UPI0022FFF032|nr:Hypothetical protein NCS54_00208100 [Fusarium falciforme]WAO84852.1 Hypothetical protein NCS54_00208100 [Fusarium falciforme]